MKLDKIRFASLIAIISSFGANLDPYRIQDIDDAINVDVPEPADRYPDSDDINNLMKLMADGKEKISAIKLHRKLTGYGLKESKDEVEKYWSTQLHRIADALGTAETGEALVEVARNAHRAEQELASQYNDKDVTLGDILSEATRARYQDG
jgi:ribosomal protein L7/L12